VLGADAARRALFEAEELLLDAEERVSIMRGGRVGGFATIRRGVRRAPARALGVRQAGSTAPLLPPGGVGVWLAPRPLPPLSCATRSR